MGMAHKRMNDRATVSIDGIEYLPILDNVHVYNACANIHCKRKLLYKFSGNAMKIYLLM